MNRVAILLMLSVVTLSAQDVPLPTPKPKPTTAPVVTEKLLEPTPTPTVQSTPTQPEITPPPVQQAVVTEVPKPVVLPTLVPITPPPTPTPVPVRLYPVGGFPAGPRIKPNQVRSQGRVGSWLIGKFVVLSQEDDYHYTCQSHVDSIGIGIVDVANHIGGGPPITLKLYLVDPPAAGLPREFAYGPLSPLKITAIHGSGGEIVVSATDLTQRK